MKRNGDSWTGSLAGHLGRGLALLLPFGATVWVFWWVFVMIDEIVPTERIFGTSVRGIGFLVVLVLALLIGLLTTDPGIRRMIRVAEGFLLRIPLFKLVYSAFRDFVSALLVKKRFDRPVLVKLGGGFDAEVVGFVTRENLQALGILDKVAVYFPQSYNIGGNVLILPRERLTPLESDSALVMSFILTGGVTSAEAQPAASPALAVQGDPVEEMTAGAPEAGTA